MRTLVILFIALFCCVQCFSGSEIEKKALVDEKEKIEPKLELCNEVMNKVKENIKYITFLDLCFAKYEFLELIESDSLFREAWKEKVKSIPIPGKDDFSINDQSINFFNEVFQSVSTNKYLEQIAFLKEYYPRVIGKNYLSKQDYGYITSIYPNTDRLAEVYLTILDLLVVDANSLLYEINKNPEAIKGFHEWLNSISEKGIKSYSIASYEMAMRKRDYIVSSLEKIDSPLAQEAKEVLKNAKIRVID